MHQDRIQEGSQSELSREDLMQAKRYAVASGNLNAAVRMDEVLKFYGNTVRRL